MNKANHLAGGNKASAAHKIKHVITRPIARGYRAVFLLAFTVSLMANTLSYISMQISAVSNMLSNDFRILLTVNSGQDKADLELMASKIQVIEGVKNVTVINRDEMLNQLKNIDGGVIDSLLIADYNILPDFIEIEPQSGVLYNLSSWLESNITGKVDGIQLATYKPEEVYAMLQVQFYRQLLNVTFAICIFVLIAVWIYVEWSSKKTPITAKYFKKGMVWVLSSALASIGASAVLWVLVYPVKLIRPEFWIYDTLQSQIIIAVAAMVLGWIFYRWKELHT